MTRGTMVALVLGVNGKPKQAVMHVERFKQGKIRPGRMRRGFLRFANTSTEWFGSHWALAIAVGVIIVWALTGPVFAFSSDWSLAINTVTTVSHS